MTALRTRGQASASAVVRAFATGSTPHAVLLTGPGGSGKTTLALDYAATLLCSAAAVGDRPCGACRGCRMVDSGNHPDLHRRGPDGAAGQVGIGAIRSLASDLALLPVEGGARVAIIEAAQRMTEDAQHALLKTLEEPPAGVTIVLCADDEDRLLPTIRSRCARVRLGTVGTRDVELLLGELDVADPPTAARLARLSGGRPGLAVAYGRAPEAVAARGEVARTLIDLLDAAPAARLRAVKELTATADAAAMALAGGPERRGLTSEASDDPAASRSPRGSAADRRRAAAWLIDAWVDVARDLAVWPVAGPRAAHDPALLEDIGAVTGRLEPGAAAAFLRRLDRAGLGLEVNASPELVIDALVLAWPRARRAA